MKKLFKSLIFYAAFFIILILAVPLCLLWGAIKLIWAVTDQFLTGLDIKR